MAEIAKERSRSIPSLSRFGVWLSDRYVRHAIRPVLGLQAPHVNTAKVVLLPSEGAPW